MEIRQSTTADAARSDIVVQPVRPVLGRAAPTEPQTGPRTPLQPAVQLDLSREARGAEPETSTKRQFARDPETDAMVFQVMDPVSGEVFLQLPDEATLRARIYARELEIRASAEPAGTTVAVA